MTDENLQKHGGEKSTETDHSAPYPVSRLAPPISLVDVAKEIEQADNILNMQVSAKLKLISDQIKSLQQEARKILEEAKLDQDLHHVPCNFKRIPGHVYHLYKRENNSRYFSMLSPADWQKKPPHSFIGSFRLEADMSWTPLEKAS